MNTSMNEIQTLCADQLLDTSNKIEVLTYLLTQEEVLIQLIYLNAIASVLGCFISYFVSRHLHKRNFSLIFKQPQPGEDNA